MGCRAGEGRPSRVSCGDGFYGDRSLLIILDRYWARADERIVQDEYGRVSVVGR